MQARADLTEPNPAVIWCEACGIPYAAGTPYCDGCGVVLTAEGDATDALAGQPDLLPLGGAAPPRLAGVSQEADAPGDDPAAPVAPAGQRGRRRVQPLSEDEVEAAAAAIIARAREAEAVAGPDPAQRDALSLLPDLLPDPVVEAALQRRRERDRAWLIAGIVCSVVLILFALVVSRYVSGVVPTQ